MISLQHVHPVLVHFPIVFFLTLAIFDLVAVFLGKAVTGRSAVANASTGLALLAGLSAIVAYFFGDMALTIAESRGFSSEIAEIHESLGVFTASAFAVWAIGRAFLWWRDIRLSGRLGAAVPVAEVLGAALVVATAYYGGQLVYELGVNVAHAAG
jgi:uncharacterized membrane protein